MSNLANDLVSLKSKIGKAETDKNKAQGQLESLQKRLADEFQCSTIEDAEKKLKKFKKQIKKKEENLTKRTEKLKDAYQW